MANINKEIMKRSLVLSVADGQNSDGSAKYKSRTFGGVKGDATVDAIFAAGTALGGLLQNAVQGIMLSEKSELAEA